MVRKISTPLWTCLIKENTFDFNCKFIYADVRIFSSADIIKNLKSTYLGNKRSYEED